MAVFDFGNQLGWFAFASVVPLIIVYLIRPRPLVLKVPSLMFFIKKTSVNVTTSLFRRFQNDLLFFLQLLVLLLLSFSILEPVLNIESDVISDNIVFVLDVSASSRVNEDGRTRLDIAKERLNKLATTRNSLILLESFPVIALQNVRRSEFVRYLDSVQPTDASSDISSAIMAAGDMIGEGRGRVVVASDFIMSKGADVILAKNILESREIGVDFIDTKVSGLRKNVGIADMAISGEEVNIYIKNFNDEPTRISLNANDETQILDIPGRGVEPYVFSIKGNLTEIKILEDDDFETDNKAVIVRPYPDSIKLLWITNKPSRFLRAACDAVEGLSVTVAEPPIIPEEEYDIYVVSDLDREQLVTDNLGGIFRKIRDEGGNAVVVAQIESSQINYEGLLPFAFGDIIDGGITQIDQKTSFTKDIDFGLVKKVFETGRHPGSIVSAGDNSVISIFDAGEGRVVYYGLIGSDFHLTPGYPIFWNNLIYSFVGRDDLNNFNLRTGTRVELGNETEALHNVGVYRLGNTIIAANLVNERESDINFADDGRDFEFTEGKLETIKSDVDYDLVFYIAFAVLMLVLFEFVYIKVRGEV